MWCAALSQESACKHFTARCAPSCVLFAHTALTHWNMSDAPERRRPPTALQPSVARWSATLQLWDSARDACSSIRHAEPQSSGTAWHVELIACAEDERFHEVPGLVGVGFLKVERLSGCSKCA